MDKVKIGFVGVGSMGQCAHLKNYVTLDDCEVVALAEVRENLGRRVAERYNVPKVYKNHEDMLSAERLDAIVAPQQFSRHGTIIPELLSAGIPVLTEKPIAAAVENGRKIVDAMKKNNTWMMVAYHKRSDPAVMYAKAEMARLKQTGELGSLKYVRILMPEGDWVASGFIDLITSNDPMPDLPGDPPALDMDQDTFNSYIGFVNYYIHQVNMMRHLLGEDYKVAYTDPTGVVMAVESESGVPGVIEMTPYRTTTDWQESLFIGFEKGWIRVGLPAPLTSNRPGKVEIYRDPGNGVVPETVSPTLPWIHAMRQQAMNFVAAVKGERPPMCTAEDALKDLITARDYIRLTKGV